MELVFISFCVKLDLSPDLFLDSHASCTAIPAACHLQLSLFLHYCGLCGTWFNISKRLYQNFLVLIVSNNLEYIFFSACDCDFWGEKSPCIFIFSGNCRWELQRGRPRGILCRLSTVYLVKKRNRLGNVTCGPWCRKKASLCLIHWKTFVQEQDSPMQNLPL